ncbi:alkaline phosphatase family protein [bacterium]|nr:alkaline phosphatase family protein [candidate division CSSED10-310 bacterium]
MRAWSGVMRTALVLVLVLATRGMARDVRPRTLYLALDAIPYETVKWMMDHGKLLPGFEPPAALVSTFPSFTTVAFTGLMEPFGVTAAPGYEARFFSRDDNRIMGGGPISYHRIPFDWRDVWDWSLKSIIRKGWIYLDPFDMASHELSAALAAFEAAPDDQFLAYVMGTDAIGHFFGHEGTERFLHLLDQELRAMLNRQSGPVRVVVFSDHGMSEDGPFHNLKPLLERSMMEAGLTLADSLDGPRDAVMVPFGLISCAEVYCDPAAADVLADALAAVPGVDLVMRRVDDLWEIRNRFRGRAIMGLRRGGDGNLWCAYQPLDGDPLAYGPVVEELRRTCAVRRERELEWFSADDWLAMTWNRFYPDVIFRVADSDRLVRNQATVLLSCAPGYVAGATKTTFGAMLSRGWLQGSHGALWWKPSLGFITTNDAGWVRRDAFSYRDALTGFAGEYKKE